MSVHPCEIPWHLTCELFDFMIIYDERDRPVVEHLCERINDINNENRINVSCCLYDEKDPVLGSIFSAVEQLTEKCVQS